MNPITSARIEAGLSKNALSRKLRLSKTFIIRAEQACYMNPGTRLVDFSTNQLNISKNLFFKRYNLFVDETRKRNSDGIEPIKINRAEKIKQTRMINLGRPVKTLLSHEIFKEWREEHWHSIVNFSAALCVHPQSVESYEKGGYDSMPVLIQDALYSVGLIDSSFSPDLREQDVWI